MGGWCWDEGSRRMNNKYLFTKLVYLNVKQWKNKKWILKIKQKVSLTVIEAYKTHQT